MVLAGVLGGMLWAALTAVLRDRFNANEILVSLMLVYVAEMLLSYLVYGPWKDPMGFNFPQTITFDASTAIPKLVDGTRANIGVLSKFVTTASPMPLFSAARAAMRRMGSFVGLFGSNTAGPW